MTIMADTLMNMAGKAATEHFPALRQVAEYLPNPPANIADADRLISLAVGGYLTVHGLTGRRTDLLSTLVGGYLLYRAVSGHCPLMQSLGLDFAGHEGPATVIEAGGGIRIEHAVTINRSPSELYRYWRSFENLPRIMSHLKSVKETGPYRSHWVAKGPLGMDVEWDAEIIQDRPNEMISWRSLPGSDIDTAGSVHFRPSAVNQWTEVRVNLKVDPPAGKLGTAAAWALGEHPEHQIRNDLERFKQFMETGEPAGTAARQTTSNR